MIRPLAFDIYGQSGQHAGAALQTNQWSEMSAIHAGVWTHPSSLTFWNACPGAGELFCSRVEVTFDGPVASSGWLPCSGWHIDPARPNVLIGGTGHEHIAPRGCLTIRWDYPTRVPVSAQYGGVKLSFAPSQKTDIFTALKAALPHARPTGMLAPFGQPQPDAPGGELIGSLAGWEQDAPGFLLRHDMTMTRMAVGRLDQHTGLPIRTPSHDYTTVRGIGKSTQLPEFCQPVTGSSDARTLLVTWPGTCSYRDLMVGVVRSNSFLPYDNQHLARALIPAKAAVQCGDPGARFDLDMIAADCQIARMDTLPNGSRDQGWTIDALLHSRSTFAIARTLIDKMVHAQTPSGAILRAPSTYPFSPTPQSFGMPVEYDSDAILERCICCHAAALDGRVDLIKRALAGMPHPVVHFVGVGQGQTMIFPTYQHPCGPGTWEIWNAIGGAAALDPRGAWWHFYALNNATPGGKRAHSLTELRDILRHETVGRDQSAALRCTLETLPL